jgi:hypothetical protein
MKQRMADKGYRGRETGDWRREIGDRERETMYRGSGQGTDDRRQRTKCFDPKKIVSFTLLIIVVFNHLKRQCHDIDIF